MKTGEPKLKKRHLKRAGLAPKDREELSTKLRGIRNLIQRPAKTEKGLKALNKLAAEGDKSVEPAILGLMADAESRRGKYDSAIRICEQMNARPPGQSPPVAATAFCPDSRSAQAGSDR